MDPIIYWGAGAGTALLGYLFSFIATLFQARESRKQLELKLTWEKQQDLKKRQVEAVQRAIRYLKDRLRSAIDGIRLDLYYVHLDGLPVARQASEVDSLRQEAMARTNRHADVALDLLLLPRELDAAWTAADNEIRSLEDVIAERKSEIFETLYDAAARKQAGQENLNDEALAEELGPVQQHAAFEAINEEPAVLEQYGGAQTSYQNFHAAAKAFATSLE